MVQLTQAEESELDHQQILAAARMHIHAARNVLPETTYLATAEDLLEQSIEKSRRLSHELSPAILHHVGLSDALKWLGHQMEEQHGLEVDLEIAPGVDSQKGPLSTFIFRSVQELLFNVVKHAQVRLARIFLHGGEGRLTVTVWDDGKGFDPAILNPSTGKAVGFGLLAIRERTLSVGGEFLVASSAGTGSRFSITIPLGEHGAG